MFAFHPLVVPVMRQLFVLKFILKSLAGGEVTRAEPLPMELVALQGRPQGFFALPY